MSFSNRPAHNCVSGVDETSRFSDVKFPCMLGVFQRAEGNTDECEIANRYSRRGRACPDTRAFHVVQSTVRLPQDLVESAAILRVGRYAETEGTRWLLEIVCEPLSDSPCQVVNGLNFRLWVVKEQNGES